MFLAVDLLDRYFEYNREKIECKQAEPIEEFSAVFVLCICLYLSINYHSITNMPLRIRDVCKIMIPNVNITDLEHTALSVSELLTTHVSPPGDIYRRTVLDMADVLGTPSKGKILNESESLQLFKYYIGRSDYNGKTVKQIYQDWLATKKPAISTGYNNMSLGFTPSGFNSSL